VSSVALTSLSANAVPICEASSPHSDVVVPDYRGVPRDFGGIEAYAAGSADRHQGQAMRLISRSRRTSVNRPTRRASCDELEKALEEIERLRREQERLIAERDSISGERDFAIRQCDRAVAALHHATGDGELDPLDDFPEYVAVPRWRPLDYPSIVVETEASDQDMMKMSRRVRGTWSTMGETEPFFTNVAHNKFMMKNIDRTKEEFFRTGAQTLSHIEAIARRQGIDVCAYQDCFELGCGVGRITAALADVFDTVHAMDVSASHLLVAREMLANARARVELHEFGGLASIDALPRFDFFVSFAVLQHNPPPLAAKLLEKILAKVRPGGAACFQCQTYQSGYRFRVAEYMAGTWGKEHARQDSLCGWEMHCLPQRVIYDAFTRNRFSLLEVRETGGLVDGISQAFFAVRQGAKR
jgi:SAM-dependent methyltransferase